MFFQRDDEECRVLSEGKRGVWLCMVLVYGFGVNLCVWYLRRDILKLISMTSLVYTQFYHDLFTNLSGRFYTFIGGRCHLKAIGAMSKVIEIQ